MGVVNYLIPLNYQIPRPYAVASEHGRDNHLQAQRKQMVAAFAEFFGPRLKPNMQHLHQILSRLGMNGSELDKIGVIGINWA